MDSVVLTDYTLYMEFEPELEADPVNQITRALRASYAKAKDRGGVLHTYSFSRVEKHADQQAALLAQLDMAATLQALAGTATIQSKADAYEVQLANATLGPYQCRIRNGLTYHSLRILGGQITKILPA